MVKLQKQATKIKTKGLLSLIKPGYKNRAEIVVKGIWDQRMEKTKSAKNLCTVMMSMKSREKERKPW